MNFTRTTSRLMLAVLISSLFIPTAQAGLPKHTATYGLALLGLGLLAVYNRKPLRDAKPQGSFKKLIKPDNIQDWSENAWNVFYNILLGQRGTNNTLKLGADKKIEVNEAVRSFGLLGRATDYIKVGLHAGEALFGIAVAYKYITDPDLLWKFLGVVKDEPKIDPNVQAFATTFAAELFNRMRSNQDTDIDSRHEDDNDSTHCEDQ